MVSNKKVISVLRQACHRPEQIGLGAALAALEQAEAAQRVLDRATSQELTGETLALLQAGAHFRAVITHTETAALDAETRASQRLADGNAAKECGKMAKAGKCYAKAQFWLDRFNKLSGRGA